MPQWNNTADGSLNKLERDQKLKRRAERTVRSIAKCEISATLVNLLRRIAAYMQFFEIIEIGISIPSLSMYFFMIGAIFIGCLVDQSSRV